MAHVTKLGIYNDALILLGERALASDTEDREPRYDLDNLYDEGGVDYCLETVKPRFATKIFKFTSVTPTLITEYTWQSPIPSDFNAMVGLFADGKLEQPIEKFYREENVILSDFQDPYLRYILDFTTLGLTNFTHSFARVVSAYFARELAVKYDPDSYGDIALELQERIKLADSIEKANEPEHGPLVQTAITADFLPIYNDALLILGLDPIASITDDSDRKNKLDYAVTAKLVESVLEDTSWGFGIETKQVFYDPGIEPAWGYNFASELPADIHRFNGIWADEFFSNPIKRYHREDGYIYSSYNVIYIEYVSTDFLTDPTLWPAYFSRMIAARLAVDAGAAIEGANIGNAQAQYTNRRGEAKSTDAIQQPPHILTEGKWARTRRDIHAGRRDRP